MGMADGGELVRDRAVFRSQQAAEYGAADRPGRGIVRI
jgi:hypothetical protein